MTPEVDRTCKGNVAAELDIDIVPIQWRPRFRGPACLLILKANQSRSSRLGLELSSHSNSPNGFGLPSHCIQIWCFTTSSLTGVEIPETTFNTP
jgi:hypothetical protein